MKIWEQQKQARPDSVCWECRHAVPSTSCGCVWSEYAIPIEGWETEIYKDKKGMKRERILFCPEFEKDTGMEKLDGELNQFRGFALAIIRQAVVDYRQAYKEWLENEEKYETALKLMHDKNCVTPYYKRIAQRYRYNPRRPWEETDIYRLIWAAYRNIRMRYNPYKMTALSALNKQTVMQECERFFKSEEMEMYSEVTGDYILREIRSSVEKEVEEERNGSR